VRFVPAAEPPDAPSGEAIWFCVRNTEVLVVARPGGAALPSDVHVEHGGRHFIGLLDGRPCWAADVAPGTDEPDDMWWENLRSLYGKVDELEWTVAGRAVQLVEWDRTHRFCGRCGTPNEPSPTKGERAKKCPRCGLLAFPRLAPAIITLVARGDEMLLARGVQFPVPMYSCLAGFVEPGETLEQAVFREVREEVGIEVCDIRYVASQPWPFPHSLMIGFTAQWAAGEIVCDPTEILDAQWYRRDELPMIPPRMSIARSLIDGFLERAV